MPRRKIKEEPINIEDTIEPPVLERELTITDETTPTPPPSPVKKIPTRRVNNWVAHVKSVSKEKNISYREAMKIAKSTYNKE